MATPVAVRYEETDVFWLPQSFGDFLAPFVLVIEVKVPLFFFYSPGIFLGEGDHLPDLILELLRFMTRHPLGKAESCKTASVGD